jgi:hypothetical protein
MRLRSFSAMQVASQAVAQRSQNSILSAFLSS